MASQSPVDVNGKKWAQNDKYFYYPHDNEYYPLDAFVLRDGRWNLMCDSYHCDVELPADSLAHVPESLVGLLDEQKRMADRECTVQERAEHWSANCPDDVKGKFFDLWCL